MTAAVSNGRPCVLGSVQGIGALLQSDVWITVIQIPFGNLLSQKDPTYPKDSIDSSIYCIFDKDYITVMMFILYGPSPSYQSTLLFYFRSIKNIS